MGIRKLKPVTPGQRHASLSDFSQLTKRTPEKSLTCHLQKHAGRNNQGKLTAYHRGGGHKKRYRLIDFKRTDRFNISGKVKAIEYDPNRNAYIMLVYYTDGKKRYHLAPDQIKVGDTVLCSMKKIKLKAGNRLPLKYIPIGFDIFNIELAPGKGGQLARSAGASAKLTSLETKHAQVQMPSSEVRYIPQDCLATIGKVINEEFSNIKIGKAGRTRWMGRRPIVRGKAKNPVDHPHGGGEGNQPIGLKYPKTPWGKPALGVKTRKRKQTNFWRIKRRVKKGVR